MKISYLLFIFSLIFTLSANAAVCGYIEQADGSLLEVNRDKVYNLNEEFLADSVPAKKSIAVTNVDGSGTIKQFKDKLKRKLIKIEFVKTSGKKLSASVPQAGSVVFFEPVSSSIVWIKLKDGVIARAAVNASTTKLKFTLNEDEFFSQDSCSEF